jgi:hypothetical protein
VDSSGHIPIPVIIGAGILILKAVDYGWTAWDAYQSSRVVADPNASEEERLLAGLNVALAGLELIEPDDVSPVSLPADDVARKGIMKAAQRALKEGGIEGVIRTARGALGTHADDILRQAGVRVDDYVWRFKKTMGRDPGGHLHHGFPKQGGLIEWFGGVGIDVHAPGNLFELPADFHTLLPDGVHTKGPTGKTWNQYWLEFKGANPTATYEEMYAYLDYLADLFGISDYRVQVP